MGDSAVAQTATGPHTVPTKPGAIPMMGNLLALTELYTRRAKSSGGALEMPWLLVAGGTTIMITAKPIGSDSMSLMIGEQEQRFRIDAAGRILGGSVIGRKLEFFRGGPETAGTFHTAVAVAPPDYSAPVGAPYTAEEVRIAGPAGKLGGTLTIPKNARGRLPAVVTITGSGQQDRDEYIPLAGGVRLFKELSDTLSRRGIAVLRLDDRGLGASGGDPSSSTSADFADDIRAAVAYLRTRPDIDPDRIALAGHSEGGMIGPMIAATDPRIRAVVTLAGPAIKGIEISMSQNKNLLDHNPLLSATQKDSILRAARKTLENQTVPWLKFFLAYDPAPVLKQVKAAVLVVQGETDQQITPNQAEMLAGYVRAGGNKDVTVKMFPATNHLFVPDSDGDPAKYNDLKSNRIRPEVLGAVADWLVAKLR
jgi:dipeptidyl aminopeptidase/acylaminoacyl peptidase